MAEPREEAESRGHSFYHKAATLSAWAVPVALAINIAIWGAFADDEESLRRTMGLMGGVGSIILIVAGLVAGIVALFGMSEHGRKGILGRAVTGIILTTAMLSCAGMTFFVLRDAKERLVKMQAEYARNSDEELKAVAQIRATTAKESANREAVEERLREEVRKLEGREKEAR